MIYAAVIITELRTLLSLVVTGPQCWDRCVGNPATYSAVLNRHYFTLEYRT